MFLKDLSLVNFKNFDSIKFALHHKVNAVVGLNGVGKTNLLDAVYHLALGKSYTHSLTQTNIQFDKDFYLIESKISADQKDNQLVCSYKKGGRKVIKKNGKIFDKISDYVGFLNVVVISPVDKDLINLGSQSRRKFFDMVLSQSNPQYLNVLIDYHRVLDQRNMLLKQAKKTSLNQQVLEIYNAQLTNYGFSIFNERLRFVDEINDLFRKRYTALVPHVEGPYIGYSSQLLHHDLMDLLSENIEKDLFLEYTSAGIHKDDYVFSINDLPIKKYGSQGQQKSFLVALKLSQFDYLRDKKKKVPILLLDDIFDKLDNNRVENLIELVSGEDFGQIFISDTDEARTEAILKPVFSDYNMIKLDK